MANNTADGYVKKVKLLLRGGLEADWDTVEDKLLIGELCYATKLKEENNISILKIGNGEKPWATLGIDENGEFDSSVFFSGRGAGIKPMVASEDKTLPLGAARLHSSTSENRKYGLSIDEDGFLSLWQENGLTVLDVDELNAKVIKGTIGDFEATTTNSMIILRQKEEGSEKDVDPLPGNALSGLRVRKYDGNHDAVLGVNVAGTWGVSYDNEGNGPEFTPFLLSNGVLQPGPLQWALLDKEKNIYGLQEWVPNTFNIQINNEEARTYNPYGTEIVLDTIKIPTLTKITVNTRETTPENPEQPGSHEYKIDESGNISIELPVLTDKTAQEWSNKLDGISINNKIIKNSDKHIANIVVDLSTLDTTGHINAPIHKIVYDGTEIVLANYTATIDPVITSVALSIPDNDNIIGSITQSTVGKNDVEYKITLKHKDHPQTIIQSLTYEMGEENNKTILSRKVLYDEQGHVNSEQNITYSFEKLLERITELETQVADLQTKVNK